MSANNALLQTKDAAVFLGVRPQTLRAWRLRGTGPIFVRMGGPKGRAAYRVCDLDTWVEAHRYASTAAETSAACMKPRSDN